MKRVKPNAGPSGRVGLLACGVALSAALLVRSSADLHAQEVSGLQVAAAMEQAVIEAISASEKSVVSIARVRGERAAPRDLRGAGFPFGPIGGTTPPSPTDPDFVPEEFGTGVIIDARGLVLTNFHFANNKNDEYYVTTSDRKVFLAEFNVKAGDSRSDLAVLEIVHKDDRGQQVEIKPGDFTPIKFGNAKTLKKGQFVIALGNPYAIARDGQVSASWGIVSNLARKAGPFTSNDLRAQKPTLHHFGTLIQTDAKLNLGTSGGALVNLKGEMVGLTTSQAAISGYEQAAGYAIPVDDAFLQWVDKLKKGEAVGFGFLGIEPKSLAHEEVLAGMHGVRVWRVSSGTPAHRAGVEANDIITHVNGQPIYDADGLRLEIGKLPPLGQAALMIERTSGEEGRKTVLRRVIVSKSPVIGKNIVTTREPEWRGLRVEFVTALSPMIPLDDFTGPAVVVDEVAEGSPAFKAGLRRGMLITSVANTTVDTPDDFRREVAAKKGPVELHLAGRIDGPTTLTIPPQ